MWLLLPILLRGSLFLLFGMRESKGILYVVVRKNLTVRKVYLSLKLQISQNVSAKLSWIKKQLKKFKKNLKKQLHELSEYYIIFSSLKKKEHEMRDYDEFKKIWIRIGISSYFSRM